MKKNCVMATANLMFQIASFMVESLQILERYGTYEGHQTSEFLQQLNSGAKLMISRSYYMNASTVSIRYENFQIK